MKGFCLCVSVNGQYVTLFFRGVMKEVIDDITRLNMCHHRKFSNPESLPWHFCLVDCWCC